MFHYPGYYSLVQYCPDVSRLESVNVGVVLFCPELSFLDLRLAKNDERISRVFKGREFRPWTLESAKNALRERLSSSSYRPRSLEEFQHFIDTRGNELVLTQARTMRVTQPADELDALFKELVLEPATPRRDRSARQVPDILEGVFSRLVLERRALRDVRAVVPLVNKQIACPYAYRNGALHYVKPQRFSPIEATATATAMKLALEGDLLVRLGADEQGQKKLVVLVQFTAGDPNQDLRERVLKVLAEYRVRAVSPEQVSAFAAEVEREAHLRDSSRELASGAAPYRQPLYTCPVCLRRLCWNLQVEPVPYLRRLASSCEEHGLEGAEWFAGAAERLGE